MIPAPKLIPRGRPYSSYYSKQPGGIKAEDLLLGAQLALCSITDDEPDTLKKMVEAGGPWHLQAMTMITGSEERAHQKLSTILSELYNLQLDKIINLSGLNRTGFLDTQGYIAHNDEMIVLSYRCTDTNIDWVNNLDMLTTEWNPERDVAHGHAGFFAQLRGYFNGKPRLHTGFYNGFVGAFPDLRDHLLPLLHPDASPKKLYIVGHSLGGGFATVATCYLLLHYDWEQSPHKLINVTVGGPRVVFNQLKEMIDEKIKVLRPLDKAVIARLVVNQDFIARMPPGSLGYKHIGKLVLFNKDGQCLINPKYNNIGDLTVHKAKKIYEGFSQLSKNINDETTKKDEHFVISEYEKIVEALPTPCRDHCPDMYLTQLAALLENERSDRTALTTIHKQRRG